MKFSKRSAPPEEFYIGYLPKAPAEYKKFVRLVIFALLVVMYFTVSFVVSNQRNFSSGIFDQKKLTVIEGVLMLQPFPAIKTFYGKDLYGNPTVKTIPLVNYGKFGADPIVEDITARHKEDLGSLWVKLRGKLIYHHGVTLLELSEKEKSVLDVSPASEEQLVEISAPIIDDMDSITLQGQIVDPKCYFGVMKPGEGKPHSDCAIRCIAGGIQPMLMIRNEKGQETFFVLRDQNGDPVNDKILSFIGIPVEVTGKLTRVDDWLVLNANPLTGIRLPD
ncbi:MAG: hypothetical protein ABIO46_12280 [Chitinophagales bacterium]